MVVLVVILVGVVMMIDDCTSLAFMRPTLRLKSSGSKFRGQAAVRIPGQQDLFDSPKLVQVSGPKYPAPLQLHGCGLPCAARHAISCCMVKAFCTSMPSEKWAESMQAWTCLQFKILPIFPAPTSSCESHLHGPRRFLSAPAKSM